MDVEHTQNIHIRHNTNRSEKNFTPHNDIHNEPNHH